MRSYYWTLDGIWSLDFQIHNNRSIELVWVILQYHEFQIINTNPSIQNELIACFISFPNDEWQLINTDCYYSFWITGYCSPNLITYYLVSCFSYETIYLVYVIIITSCMLLERFSNIHFVVGCYAPQVVIDQAPSLDLKRTSIFTLLGLVLVGPALHFW